MSGFDLDLYQCTRCERYWARAWRETASGWEPVTADDAATMQRLSGPSDEAELRVFTRTWARELF